MMDSATFKYFMASNENKCDIKEGIKSQELLSCDLVLLCCYGSDRPSCLLTAES